MLDLETLQTLIGYRFSNPRLLQTAVTHRSYRTLDLACEDYERLEFLGDAVLGIVVSRILYDELDLPAGDLTKRTSQVVSRAACERVARHIGLEPHVLVGPAASVNGTSILSNVVEAVLGAVYLEGGLEASIAFVRTHFGQLITEALAAGVENPKALLNELFLKEHKAAPVYRVIESTGPDHAPTYVVEALFEDHVLGCGRGKNKREAEASAARDAIETIKKKSADV